MEVKLAWVADYATGYDYTYMEAEDDVFNFKFNLRSLETSYNETSMWFTNRDDQDTFINSTPATKSLQLAKTLLYNETTLYCVEGSVQGFSVNDLVYLGSEILKISSITLSSGGFDLVVVTRGRNAQAFPRGTVATNRKPIIGAECYLLDKNDLPIRYMYIKEVRTIGAGYELIFDDMINLHEKPYLVTPSIFSSMQENLLSLNPYDAIILLGFIHSKNGFRFVATDNSTVDLLSYMNLSHNWEIPIDTETPFEVDVTNAIEIIKKTFNVIPVFNFNEVSLYGGDELAYYFVKMPMLTEVTPYTTMSSKELDDKILMERGYNFTKTKLGVGLKMSYQYTEETDLSSGYSLYSGTTTRFDANAITGDLVNLDLGDAIIRGLNKEQVEHEVDKIFDQYKQSYNRLIGVLECDIPYEDNTFSPGDWIKLSDTNYFDIIKETTYDTFLYLVSRDNDVVTFFVLQTQPSAFVGLSIPVRWDNASPYDLYIEAPFFDDNDFDISSFGFAATEYYPEGVNLAGIKWYKGTSWQVRKLDSPTPTSYSTSYAFAISSMTTSGGVIVITTDRDLSTFLSDTSGFYLLEMYKNTSVDYYLTEDSGV